MTIQKPARSVEKKGRSKKRKSRTEVSSSESSSDSSESESEIEVKQKKSRKSLSVDSESSSSTPEPTTKTSKKSKATPPTNGDTLMRDASPSSSPAPVPISISNSKVASKLEAEEFDAIYIRKITTELADDLDKVREAQDFKANSIPMLIHALKQGEALFSGEEKRRVVATSKA